MKTRPILFSAPMVQALLDGRKTQTRRTAKDIYPDANWCGGHVIRSKSISAAIDAFNERKGMPLPGDPTPCPYGQPGDLLWVREAFSGPHCMEKTKEFPALPPGQWPEESEIWYWADGEPDHGDWTSPRPSIHMPRAASRLTLEITGVRVERLNDISEADAQAEGLGAITKDGKLVKYGIPDSDGLPGTDNFGWPWDQWDRDPRVAYQRLWESLKGPGSWDANPWVWVLEFKVHRCNV